MLLVWRRKIQIDLHHVRRRKARANHSLLARVEKRIASAATALLQGDPLAALRTARAAEQLLALDARLRVRHASEAAALQRIAEAERAIAAARRDLDHRAQDLALRERELEAEAVRLAALRAETQALYTAMFAKSANETDAELHNAPG